MKPTVYLDIDGVLLANEDHAANFANEFIKHVVTNYRVKWLTTHCHGDATTPIQHVGHLFEPETVEYMRKIGATDWTVAKTEAIDFSEPFLVFEDDMYDEERQTLIEYGVLDNWIMINLLENENQLADFIRSFPIPVEPTPITPKAKS